MLKFSRGRRHLLMSVSGGGASIERRLTFPGQVNSKLYWGRGTSRGRSD